MQYRLRTEAPGGPADVRFLHVLEGADAGASATPVSLVEDTGRTSFEGAVVGETVVLFPYDLDDLFTGLTYTVPVTVSVHYITGLTPKGGYTVVTQTVGGAVEVTVSAGGGLQADGGGVLAIGAQGGGSAAIYLPLVLRSSGSALSNAARTGRLQ